MEKLIASRAIRQPAAVEEDAGPLCRTELVEAISADAVRRECIARPETTGTASMRGRE